MRNRDYAAGCGGGLWSARPTVMSPGNLPSHGMCGATSQITPIPAMTKHLMGEEIAVEGKPRIVVDVQGSDNIEAQSFASGVAGAVISIGSSGASRGRSRHC